MEKSIFYQHRILIGKKEAKIQFLVEKCNDVTHKDYHLLEYSRNKELCKDTRFYTFKDLCDYIEGLDDSVDLSKIRQEFLDFTREFIYSTYKTSINTPFDCPLCNSKMIEQDGPYGKFYTCSMWKTTKCKGKRNAKGSYKIEKETKIKNNIIESIIE